MAKSSASFPGQHYIRDLSRIQCQTGREDDVGKKRYIGCQSYLSKQSQNFKKCLLQKEYKELPAP